MSDDAKNDLAALLPGRDVTVTRVGATMGQPQAPETIRVVPLYFGQYPTAAKLARPLVQALNNSGVFAFDGKTMSLASNWVAALPGLLEEGGEAVMAFLAFCIAKPRAWLDTLPGDEGFDLAHAVIEENRSFFAQRVLPKLKAAGLLKVTEDSAGAPSLPDSSPTATDGPTSSPTP